MTSICRILSCQKYSTKTPNNVIKQISLDFRLSSDDPVSQRPMLLPDFDSQSMYVPGTDPSDVLPYQVAVLIPDEEQSEQDIVTL